MLKASMIYLVRFFIPLMSCGVIAGFIAGEGVYYFLGFVDQLFPNESPVQNSNVISFFLGVGVLFAFFLCVQFGISHFKSETARKNEEKKTSA